MKNEKGFSLVEVLISLALIGIIGVAFLSSLATASNVTFTTDEKETAKNLAELQMEYVKGQAYASSYTPASIPPDYVNYTATINAASLQNSNIQKITVTIQHEGKTVIELEGYKVK